MLLFKCSQLTHATPEQVWELLTNVSKRPAWDHGLEICQLPGPYQRQAQGSLKLKGQKTMPFEVTECTPLVSCTDRVHMPLGNSSDWIHTLERQPEGTQVTFEIRLAGPTAFLVGPIMRAILKKEIPPTVQRLTKLAEAAT